MNELIKLIEECRLWSYTLEDGGTGLVIADTVEEAEEKVRAAYSKHGGYENGKCDVKIYIWDMFKDSFFPDFPDVLEVHS